jgi:hypothetical protein
MRYLRATLSGIMMASLFSFVILILQSFENAIKVSMGTHIKIFYNIEFFPVAITFTLFAGSCIALLMLLFGGKK